MRRRARRVPPKRWRRVAFAAIAVAITMPSAHTAVAEPGMAVMPDAWSPPITFRDPDASYPAPWHAALLPDGRLFFIGMKRPTYEPSPYSELTGVAPSAFTLTPAPAFPAELVVDGLKQPVAARGVRIGSVTVNDSLECSGSSPLADGRLLTVGGTRSLTPDSGTKVILGLPTATVYDGSSWIRLNAQTVGAGRTGSAGRWYPTVTRLADGRMLVTGGFDMVAPSPLPNLSTEVFDPATETFSADSAFGAAPFDIYAADYPFVYSLPSSASPHEVMTIGETGVPMLHDVGGAWDVTGRPRTGSVPEDFINYGATSAMLPLRLRDGEWGYANGSAIVSGGLEGSVQNHTADVFDPARRRWTMSVDLGIGRLHGTSVVLPDDRLLVVNGHGATDDARPAAQYIDPASGFVPTVGASEVAELRGYHNLALLLPDGRVLVAGGRDRNRLTSSEKVTFRYYYPWYMFTDRPVIRSAPPEIRFGQPFDVITDGPAPEYRLMGLGSVTHSFDQNQRSVQLEVTGAAATPGGVRSTVVAPIDGHVAPPGYYMLFAVGAGRVPSVASIVKVS